MAAVTKLGVKKLRIS